MAIYNSSLLKKICSGIILLFFISCIYEKEKKPYFISNIEAVKNSIRKIIGYQEIKFNGSEQFVNKESNSLLQIEIIDPPILITFEDHPQEDTTLREIGKKIMLNIKGSLKDSNEYDTYTIKFTHKDHNWRNSSISRNYVYVNKDF